MKTDIKDAADIMSHVDHTVLAPDATWKDIEKCVDDAVKYGCAVAMVPPCYVDQAYAHAEGRVGIATVVGFPHGNSTSEAKAAEAADAVANGASEVDMVANISFIKDGRFGGVLDDIARVKEAIGDVTLKVIIESCLLTEEEQIRMCGVCRAAGAEYVKTSTGFSSGGATPGNVKLLVDNAPTGLLVKAAGGIKSMDDARAFLELGADRLGTSRLVKLLDEGGC